MSDTAPIAALDAAGEPLIVSVSGLRGVVGESLTPEVAARYAAAFAATLPPGPIVLSRDGRASGPVLAAAIATRLSLAGRDVIDCGVAATPKVGIAVREHAAAGGIQISASHNPARYNGLKLFAAAGRVLPAAAGREVLAGYRQLEAREAGGPTGLTMADCTSAPQAEGRAAESDQPPAQRVGSVVVADPTAAHVRLVAALVDSAAIRRRRPKVWIDCGHGAGSRVALPLLDALGCDVVAEGTEPDGRFEHEPEPTAENLAGLLPRIAAVGADIGFFQDPDADRLAIADASGRYLGEEATLALCVEAVLAKTPGPVVVNCSTSGMTAAIAARDGAPCHVAAVGEANVVDAMLAHGAVLGGEGNGGVIDPRVVLVRDSAIAMALVLERMCAGDRLIAVADLAVGLPQLVMKKTKVCLSPATRGPGLAAGLDRIAAAFPEACPSRLDGLRLDYPGGWLLVRASNTEPIVRLVAEQAVGPEGERQAAASVEAALARAAAALGS
ncbi:MAG: phosphoglucosamine mutase [Planctomycetota bacterium]